MKRTGRLGGLPLAAGLLAMTIVTLALASCQWDSAPPPTTLSESVTPIRDPTPGFAGGATRSASPRRTPSTRVPTAATEARSTASSEPAPSQDTTPTAIPAQDIGQFQAQLEGFINEQEGVYGLALRDMASGETVLINADRVFPAASTYKLLVMYRVFQQADAGRLALDDMVTIIESDAAEDEPDDGLWVGAELTVAESLESMITVSSNYAAYALVRLTGGWGELDRVATELGMGLTGNGEEYFYTSPGDLLMLLEQLAQGQLVSADASASMLALLRKQTRNDRLPAQLPEGAVVAHKTGELAGVRHDAGIIAGPGGSLVICVLTRSADEEAATRAIAEIARRAYGRYAE
ncbi:MAG: serine hydrolase [Chloroflexota bacterium]